MLKQMCWLSTLGTKGTKILHLRTDLTRGWRPYTACPQYSIPDYQIPGGSAGYATFQKLLSLGWTLLPSAQFQQSDGVISQTSIEETFPKAS